MRDARSPSKPAFLRSNTRNSQGGASHRPLKKALLTTFFVNCCSMKRTSMERIRSDGSSICYINYMHGYLQ